jgi:peroxiredoxin
VLGRELPDLALPASDGSLIELRRVPGLCVCFCYPYTGKPGVPDPDGWDEIPGAHGSTPQALGYAAKLDAFRQRGAQVFGLSFDTTEWQREFILRTALRIALLSDADRNFASALRLPTFMAGGRKFLSRITLITRDGRIATVNIEIPNPADDANRTISLIDGLA